MKVTVKGVRLPYGTGRFGEVQQRTRRVARRLAVELPANICDFDNAPGSHLVLAGKPLQSQRLSGTRIFSDYRRRVYRKISHPPVSDVAG